jgi:hypothetical protein
VETEDDDWGMFDSELSASWEGTIGSYPTDQEISARFVDYRGGDMEGTYRIEANWEDANCSWDFRRWYDWQIEFVQYDIYSGADHMVVRQDPYATINDVPFGPVSDSSWIPISER